MRLIFHLRLTFVLFICHNTSDKFNSKLPFLKLSTSQSHQQHVMRAMKITARIHNGDLIDNISQESNATG